MAALAKLNQQDTNHGKMDLPFASLNNRMGRGTNMEKGSARTRKFAEGGGTTDTTGFKKGGNIMAADKGKKLPPWLMKKGADDGGGKAPPFGKKFAAGGAIKTFAKGGGIESRGKTRGKIC